MSFNLSKNFIIKFGLFASYMLGSQISLAGDLSNKPVLAPNAKVIQKFLTSTIYNKPLFRVDLKTCKPANQYKDIVDENGKILATLCEKDYHDCVMQGACYIEDKNGFRSVNFQSMKNGRFRFVQISLENCPMGLGVNEVCLDPFFSLAADMNYFKVGDVVYIPQINGMKLPTGETHNGYFIIRDRGGKILGPNRFDFFSGFFGFRTQENPFAVVGLGSSNKKFTYVKVSDPGIISKVKSMRNYPGVPAQVKSYVKNFLSNH